MSSGLDDTAGCRPWVDQELGPYHRDLESMRDDIVEDRAGVPLQLEIRLVGPDGVTPVTGAVVEIWQCDAVGRYSGFPPPNVQPADTAASLPPGEGALLDVQPDRDGFHASICFALPGPGPSSGGL